MSEEKTETNNIEGAEQVQMDSGSSSDGAGTALSLLVPPDIEEIKRCSFYWEKIGREEAEILLGDKPDGTFILRDSADKDHLLTVSYRRYGRNLHQRVVIKKRNKLFTFDSADPATFSSATVLDLVDHYNEESRCAFFEPLLTIPLQRGTTQDV